jgi:hypothetical protein
MSQSTHVRLFVFFGWFLLMVWSFTGCAARRPAWMDMKNGIVLEYKMPEKPDLRYRNSSQMIQTMKVGEQSMVTQINNMSVLSLRAKGRDGTALRIHVTVDSARLDVQSPAGNMSPDLGSIIGKGFDMTLSTLGKEIDVSEAATLKYNLGQAGERTLESEFQAFFEDLPGKPVKPGESWTSTDTLNINQAGNKTQLIFNNRNTFQAVETVQGLNCVRIQTESTGIMKGSGDQGGAQFTIEGTLKAHGTWYFAVQEGILAKSSSEATTESTVQIIGPQDMKIPMTMVVKAEKAAVR